jgi:hypothetical protein
MEISLLLCVLLRETIYAASSSHPHFAPWWELGIFLAGTDGNCLEMEVSLLLSVLIRWPRRFTTRFASSRKPTKHVGKALVDYKEGKRPPIMDNMSDGGAQGHFRGERPKHGIPLFHGGVYRMNSNGKRQIAKIK